MFIDGYLALATAYITTTLPDGSTVIAITEFAGPGYARQPISFGVPKAGSTFNSRPFTFGFGLGAIAGRAIFQTPTGTDMLLTLPFAAPYGYGSQPDTCDIGALALFFPDLAAHDPEGASTLFQYYTGQVIGTCWRDPQDFNGYTPALTPAGVTIPGGPQRRFATGNMIAGTSLTIKRGVLSDTVLA